MEFWFNMNYMVFLCFPWTPTNFHDSGPPITDEVCEKMMPIHLSPDPVQDIEFIFSEDVCYNVGSSINGENSHFIAVYVFQKFLLIS